MKLLLATNNRHKVEELSAILAGKLPSPPELVCAADFPHIPEPIEDGETFEANALIKARAYASATGHITLADDSGLVVDALEGRPGIHSARYAETAAARNQRVLDEMAAVPEDQRSARFVCVMAMVDPGQQSEWTREGRVEGRINHGPLGEGGFGYDPIFELTETEHAGLTTAQLPADIKNGLSHRGRAVQAILPQIIALLR